MNKNTKIIIGVSVAIILILIIIVAIILSNNNKPVTGQTNAKGEQVEKVSNKGMLEITDSGWSMGKSLGEYSYLTHAVCLENKSDKVASFVDVCFTAKDKDGKIIFTTSGVGDMVDYILPGEKIYVADDGSGWENIGKPESVDFFIDDVRWENAITFNYPKNMDFEVNNISKRDDTFTGEVKNNSSTDINNAIVTVIYKKEGKIIGGNYTYVNNLNANETKPFQIYSGADYDYDSYEISARVGSVN